MWRRLPPRRCGPDASHSYHFQADTITDSTSGAVTPVPFDALVWDSDAFSLQRAGAPDQRFRWQGYYRFVFEGSGGALYGKLPFEHNVEVEIVPVDCSNYEP